MTSQQLTIKQYLADRAKQVDGELERLMPLETVEPISIHKAMRYSLFAGGKRIRPVLCLEAARAVAGRDPRDCRWPARWR